MKIHINYAHNRYLNSQRYCCETAIKNGFDLTRPFSFGDLDEEFVSRNSYTLSQARGAGFWVWKPYIILKTLLSMGNEDWLMYTDSGMHFVRNPWDWILPESNHIGEKGIATFSVCGLNKQFTKRDTFILMGLDTPQYTDSHQRMASVFVCRRTPFSVSFVEEWLSYANDPRIITDLPNTQGLPNYPEFRDHRHDQSIMSLLCIKHNTFLFQEDITQYTNSNPYIIHTRNPS